MDGHKFRAAWADNANGVLHAHHYTIYAADHARRKLNGVSAVEHTG